MTFPGYMRPDGSVGTRNCVVMMPTVMCVNHVASRIAQGVDADGSGARVATMPHAGGCTVGADLEQTVSVLAGLGAHPNVAAVLIVNLGCEMVEPRALTDRITQMAPWKRVESIVVQETGVVAAIDRGVEIVRDMVHESSVDRRLEVDVSNLTLATECGGSDATSGIAANPALGLALDRLIDLGGSAMFGETSEAMGTEHLLCARAADETVARKLVRKLDAARDRMAEALPDGEHFLALGNIEGGLSTLEEKSLGAISKSGSRPIVETLDYGTMPTRKGLAFVDGTAYDVVSMTGMVAGGAQVVAFTTGKGTPVGCHGREHRHRRVSRDRRNRERRGSRRADVPRGGRRCRRQTGQGRNPRLRRLRHQHHRRIVCGAIGTPQPARCRTLRPCEPGLQTSSSKGIPEWQARF